MARIEITRSVDFVVNGAPVATAEIAFDVDLNLVPDEAMREAAISRGLVVSEAEHQALLFETDNDSRSGFEFETDVERLAEFIAAGDIDAALELLSRMASPATIVPANVKRLVADRRARPATRAA